jgi:large subunit ribosomal protein L25
VCPTCKLPGAEIGKEIRLANQVLLQVASRTMLGKRVKQLRRQGIIPANLYGRHQPSLPLQVDFYALDRFLAGQHAAHVVDLRVEGSKSEVHNALLRHIARSPRSGKILHLDFLRVSMSEPVTVHVPVSLKGTAPAVAVDGGVLLHMLDALEVECLPGDIPDSLELDISSMAEMDATLHVRDVVVPRGVTLLSDLEEPIVKVVAPRAVLAEEAAEAAKEAEAAEEAATPAAATEKSEEASQ